jgi:hypothetical protein
MSRKTCLLIAALLVVGVVVPNALGCPVCYGNSDDQIVKGAQISVLFMAGLTYVLLLSGAGLAFFVYRQRLRRRFAAPGETPPGPVGRDHEPALEGA